MKINKKSLVFVFLMVMAMVIGTFLAVQCSANSHSLFHFLSYSYSIGFDEANPLILDLVIIKITLGFTLNISIAHGLCILLAIIFYPKIASFVQ